MLDDLLRGSFLRGTSKNRGPYTSDRRDTEDNTTCNICGSNQHSAPQCIFTDLASMQDTIGCEDDNQIGPDFADNEPYESDEHVEDEENIT